MLPVLIAFAGVLIAAVATGVLAGRCVRQPLLCLAVWTVAALGLLVALTAAGVGLATGFGPSAFRAVEVGGQLIAPLWLAWGLIEFVIRSEAIRFGTRLIFGFALTVVTGLILATDTLTAVPFSKAWPAASQHYQPVSRDVLLLAQAVAVIGTLAAVGVARVRARSEPEWARALAGVGALGLAVLLAVALRLPLPARSAYPLAAALAAGLVWFGVTRGLGTVEDSWRSAGREDRSPQGPRSPRDGSDSQSQRDSRGFRDQRDEAPRYGRHGRRPDAGDYEPSPYRQDPYRQDPYGQDPYGQDEYYQDQHGHGPASYGQDQHGPASYGQDQHGPGPYGQDQHGPASYGQDQHGPSSYGPGGRYSRASYHRGPDPSAPGLRASDQYGSADGYGRDARYERDPGYRQTGYGRDSGYEVNGRGERSDPRTTGPRVTGPRVAGPSVAGPALTGPAATGPRVTGPRAELGAESALPSGGAQSRPYGRIQIFTLLDDKAADFDRLAEQTAEEVRIGEPDTLVYVIHLVPNAPMQRIFYEIYRDRAAFDSHENKSYTQRFVAERRSYVLATNVIELRLKYAKVAPLPIDSRQLEAGHAARAQLPPGLSAPRQAGGSGQWSRPPADQRHGGV